MCNARVARAGLGALLLAVPVAGGLFPAGLVAADDPPVCTTETLLSDATPLLLPGDSIDTGLVAPAVTGTSMTVVGVSADGVDQYGYATTMRVEIGGTQAIAGTVVDGGAVVITNQSAVPLRSTGVIVVIDRCTNVAVEPPPPTVPPTTVPPGGGALPTTGPGARVELVAASSVLLVGLLLVLIARPRSSATAGDRGPGSPPDARRRARG